MPIFLLKNVSSFCFCSKNTCEFDIVLSRTVKILTTNDFVNEALNNWALDVPFIWSYLGMNIHADVCVCPIIRKHPLQHMK